MTTSAPAAEAIATSGLTKKYDDLVALSPLDLTIAQGESVALLGHNGSGKTTLLRMLSGLLDPSDGTIAIMGNAAGSLRARSELCYLPDAPVLYDDLSVIEHLEYVGRLHGALDWAERADELLEVLGLSARRDDLPSRFSRGLKQKTAIAVAMIRPFDVLLVDEPFVGLDAAGKEAMLELLSDMNKDGATVIVATHQLEYIEQATRVIALRDGQVTFDGAPDPSVVRELVQA